MRSFARSAAVAALIMVATLSGASGATAFAPDPIGPKQHFIGLVNGSNFQATVYTACGGPIGPGRTGPVVDGALSVARVAKRHGATGPLSQVYAWFVPDASGPPPQMVKFSDYGVAQPVPEAVRVPCDGKGKVQFSPCPYLAPCVAGWVPDLVSVRFVNVAD